MSVVETKKKILGMVDDGDYRPGISIADAEALARSHDALLAVLNEIREEDEVAGALSGLTRQVLFAVIAEAEGGAEGG